MIRAGPRASNFERRHLLACLPGELVVRIEHFGSTAVPGLAAKPIVDMLVEVSDLAAVRERVVPVLESQGYDYFWRPTAGDDGPPYYAWFIKRDPATGQRTHHIHMVTSEDDFAAHWDQLLFRDYLIEHPEVAREYETLKRRLATDFANDRVRYTQEKTGFITAITKRAKDDSGPLGVAMPDVVIRPAKPEDVPGITACVDEAYVHYIERIGKQPAPMLEDFADVVREFQAHVAVAAGKIVGAVIFKVTDEGFYVDNVAVRPSIRGKGIGRRLLELAEAEARRQGYESIYLATHELMTENRALYARAGYVEYDHRIVDGYPRVFFRKALS